MNVYEHRLSTLTWPGQGELRNKEHSEPPLFWPSQPGKGQHEDLMLTLPEHCHQWRENAPASATQSAGEADWGVSERITIDQTSSLHFEDPGPPQADCEDLQYAPLWSSLPWPDLWFSLPSKQIPGEL